MLSATVIGDDGDDGSVGGCVCKMGLNVSECGLECVSENIRLGGA